MKKVQLALALISAAPLVALADEPTLPATPSLAPIALSEAAATDGLAGPLAADDIIVVRAFFDDPEMVRQLRREYAPWRVVQEKGYLEIGVNQAGLADLRKRGFRLEVDVAQTASAQRGNQRLSGQGGGIPGFPCYRTVEETYATAEAIVAANPQLASWTDIGDSWEKANGLGGYDLFVLKLTNSAVGGDKPVLFSMTSVHAREYTPAELNTRFAEYLIDNYGIDADATWLLDHHEIHLLLQANPDGRKQAETGLSWRKNTNQNYCGADSNQRGADLNRNFPFLWDCCGGSSDSECSDTYHGASAASEDEIQAIVNYTDQIFIDQRQPGLDQPAPPDATGIFLDIHSSGRLMLWSWGVTQTPPPNAPAIVTLGRKIAWFNDHTPQPIIQLTVADGSTVDYAYGKFGVASYGFELGSRFFEECDAFESDVLPGNLEALIHSAKVARTPYLQGGGPDAYAMSLSSTVSADGNPVTLTATLDDTRFNNSNGVEPVQSVSAGEVYIDVPPWSSDATPEPILMQPVDGSFDSSVEQAVVQIATTGLSVGQHTLFTRAQDSDGNWGVINAEFLYIVDEATAPRVTGSVIAADTGMPVQTSINADERFETATDAQGAYELLLIPGVYDVTAIPDDANYPSKTVRDVAANEMDVIEQDFVLFPFCEVFADDVESGNVGWTPQAPWDISSELSLSPSNAWSDSPGGNYQNNTNVALTSPVFDFSAVDGVRLQFAHICATEPNFDFCNVEASTDGVNWTRLAAYDGVANSWETVTLDAAMLAGASTAQIRFRLSTDTSSVRDGWHVDDISISVSGAQCIAADADSDGISDNVDNCTLIDNPDQRDTNGDGFGNACDADLDNDGVINFTDLALLKDVFFQPGDLDGDFNGDGMVNFSDLAIMKDAFFGEPGPSGQ